MNLHLMGNINTDEKCRLKNSFHTYTSYNVHSVFNSNFFNKDNKLDPLWMIYFLVYGTGDFLKAKINPGKTSYLNLKEILYAEDHEETPSILGSQLLKVFTRYGVQFEPSMPNKVIILGGHKGKPYSASAKDMNKWFNQNKLPFEKYPHFSKETIIHLKKHYPQTFEQLKNLLEPQYRATQTKKISVK